MSSNKATQIALLGKWHARMLMKIRPSFEGGSLGFSFTTVNDPGAENTHKIALNFTKKPSDKN